MKLVCQPSHMFKHTNGKLNILFNENEEAIAEWVVKKKEEKRQFIVNKLQRHHEWKSTLACCHVSIASCFLCFLYLMAELLTVKK